LTKRVGELIRTAAEELDSENFSEALALYQEAVIVRKNDADLWNNLGYCFLCLGDYRNAVTALKRARKFEPRSSEILTNLALACQLAGQNGEAAWYFEQLTRLKPGDPQVHANLAACYTMIGDYAAALNSQVKAYTLDPCLSNKTALAACLAHNGRYPEALDYFEAAYLENPDDLDNLTNLAVFLENLGKFREAAKLYQKARLLAPNDAEILYGLATCLYRTNQLEQACRAVDDLLHHRPGSLPGRKLKSLIEEKLQGKIIRRQSSADLDTRDLA